MTWTPIDEKRARVINLQKGDLVRFKLSRPDSRSPDGYVYGRAVGGFGMVTHTMGRAVFVENESWTEEGARDRTATDSARWNRGDFPIEVEVVE